MDHQALKYFLTKPRLNTRQAVWATHLADFHLTIQYKAGVMNHAVASEFPAPVPYLPMFPSISATLLVEIRLGYVLLTYSLWYFVIYFGNAL